MLDLRKPLEGTDAPDRETTEAEVRVQTTEPLLLYRESAEAAKAVEIANTQEQRVGAQRKNPGGQPQKYFLSDEGRALILARYDSQTETITWLAEQLSTPEHPLPRWQIRKWAKDLGIARVKDLPWSEAEVSYLRNSVRRYGLEKIAKALGRSETSVKLKAKRLGIRKIVTGDGYTMRSVCRGLSVDHHQIERWLANGWFWGERRQSRRHGGQRGDIWYFSEEAIRVLVREHPEEIDLRRVDRTFFIEILLGPPQGEAVRPAPTPLRRAFRSAYAFMSDEAHTLLIAHYTGGLRRTEALAEVLGVSPDEITTWAVLLGLEEASLHSPRVHQQERRRGAERTRANRGDMSKSVRHLLEMRFTGDSGSTQALADDLGLTVEEIGALAQSAGIHATNGKGEAPLKKRRTTGRDPQQDQERPAEDLIPLQAQVLIAMHYDDTDGTRELLADELTRLLEVSDAPISTRQIDVWARRLGLRIRRKQREPRTAGNSDKQATRKTARHIAPGALQLDASEWARLLSPEARHTFLPGDGVQALSTVEEIRLGYLVRAGTLERGKAPTEQDPNVIDAALQAEARLAAALLPLLWRQALIRLGQGVSLEALLTVGRCGLDEAIFQFDYADSHPLLSYALPAINEELERLIANTAITSRPERRSTKKLQLYERIADASRRFARLFRSAPTIEVIAEALSLAQDHVEKTVRFVIEAQWIDEDSEDEGVRRQEKVPDVQFIGAFMKTRGQCSNDIIKELAEVFPLTPLTIQVKFYALRLHTRIAERDRRQEMARLRIEAQRAAEPFQLQRGHSLWDVVIDGQMRRWALAMPYGTLADAVSTGSRVCFEDHLYEASRVYYSTLVIQSVEAGIASPIP